GKKITTWFKRSSFLAVRKEKEEKNELNEIDTDNLGTETEKNDLDEEDDMYNSVKIMGLNADVYEFVENRIKKRKGLKNISALNILIRRSLLLDNNLTFDESIPVFTDLIFVSKLFTLIKSAIYVQEAMYVKRKRNNPVQYPSINQINYDNRFDSMLYAYMKSTEELLSFPTVQQILEQKMINYYCNYFVTRLRRSEMSYWKNERFLQMVQLSKQWNVHLISEQNFYKRRLIAALRNGNRKKSLFWINLHLGRKKAKKLLHNRKLLSTYLYFHYFSKMSIKQNYVMCETFLGRNYADSPKNIFEYMSKTYPGKYKFIWSVDKKTKFPYPCKKVKRFGIRYAYYLGRSKYFIFNMRQPVWMRKRKDTVFIQTWHGTPLKKLVFDQEEVMSATPLYKKQVYEQSRIWDYLISDNAFSTEVFGSAFLYDKEILESGYPRNDLLYQIDMDQIAKKIKRKLKLPANKKIILYAPTWRDDEYYDKGQYKFELHMDLVKYQKELGDEYIILVRTHYFISDQLDLNQYKGFAHNVSKYDDISELYLISDICITDYSSVFFDYANLRRPILFYTYDLEKYRDMLRGFYLDIEKDVPGPLLFNDEQVIESIKNIEQVKIEYKKVYEDFCNRFCYLDDGNASKRIVEKVFK
ncbi:CDP-glycerol glycerophosphotransferase family protein, partial [Anaerosporobacter sp.]